VIRGRLLVDFDGVLANTNRQGTIWECVFSFVIDLTERYPILFFIIEFVELVFNLYPKLFPKTQDFLSLAKKYNWQVILFTRRPKRSVDRLIQRNIINTESFYKICTLGPFISALEYHDKLVANKSIFGTIFVTDRVQDAKIAASIPGFKIVLIDSKFFNNSLGRKFDDKLAQIIVVDDLEEFLLKVNLSQMAV
jgi:phosphoglycolate phosphatase-like HAD superfamily hydrolase